MTAHTFINYHVGPRTQPFLSVTLILAPLFLRVGAFSMTSKNDASISSSSPTSSPTPPRNISGRCLCGAVTWSVSAAEAASTGSQVLVCHCDYCRRQSGSWHIPWLAVPRTTALGQTLGENRAVSEYRASNVAKRGFCRHCGSSIYMDYGEKHTLWMAMGTLDDNNETPSLCAARDCHLYVKPENKRQEDMIATLPHYPDFGSYRPDPCQPAASWRDLPTWQQVDRMATFVREQQETGDRHKQENAVSKREDTE